MRDPTAALMDWLEKGGRRIGQIAIARAGDAWELRHADDAGREGLELFTRAEDARQLANFDDAGAYRPLKTAPNLRHGWRLVLVDADGLRRALDYFHPAMLGVWLAHRDGELAPVPLRETLGRQTGMYRITQKLTDEQARALVARMCCEGACLKTRLWSGADDSSAALSSGDSPDVPASRGNRLTQAESPSPLPLLCHEACNLLVAEARKVVKGEAP